MSVQQKTAAVILKTYFGNKEGGTTADFIAELKALSQAERYELAELAAKELGFTVTEIEAARKTA